MLMGAVSQSIDWTSTSSSYLPFMAYCFANALLFYLGHSGLASVQIGLMHLCGWRVPERYNRPFLATSPADFWRRWNVYVTNWARRYVFRPLAFWLGGRRVGLSQRKAIVVAVVLTFGIVGALHVLSHQAAAFAGETGQIAPSQVMLAFLGFGLLFVIWEGVGRHKIGRAGRAAEVLRALRPIGAWLVFMHIQAVALWFVFAVVL
jgi:D-alanyl-lipoteichoic acid acyltransferase DltB (MBOAT superfamily)